MQFVIAISVSVLIGSQLMKLNIITECRINSYVNFDDRGVLTSEVKC